MSEGEGTPPPSQDAGLAAALGGALEGQFKGLLKPLDDKIKGILKTVETLSNEKSSIGKKDLEKVREFTVDSIEEAKTSLTDDMVTNLTEICDMVAALKDDLEGVRNEAEGSAQLIDKVVSDVKAEMNKELKKGLNAVVTTKVLGDKLLAFKGKLEKSYKENTEALKKDNSKVSESLKFILEEAKNRADWAVETVGKQFGELKSKVDSLGAKSAGGDDSGGSGGVGLTEEQVIVIVERELRNVVSYIQEEVIPKAIEDAQRG